MDDGRTMVGTAVGRGGGVGTVVAAVVGAGGGDGVGSGMDATMTAVRGAGLGVGGVAVWGTAATVVIGDNAVGDGAGASSEQAANSMPGDMYRKISRSLKRVDMRPIS